MVNNFAPRETCLVINLACGTAGPPVTPSKADEYSDPAGTTAQARLSRSGRRLGLKRILKMRTCNVSYKDFAGSKPAWLFRPNQRRLMNHSDLQLRSSTNEPFAALVGLDWADEKHAVALLATGSQIPEHTTLEHTPEALSDWVAQLHPRFAGGQIAIILEQSRGWLLYALLPQAHLVLYPINPQMAAKFRKAF